MKWELSGLALSHHMPVVDAELGPELGSLLCPQGSTLCPTALLCSVNNNGDFTSLACSCYFFDLIILALLEYTMFMYN